MTTLIESTKKPEFELKPIEQIIKRYKQILRECNREYDRSDKDIKKFNHICYIQKEILQWVLNKD